MAKGQMLPPSTGAPLEVTPEFVEQEARSGAASGSKANAKQPAKVVKASTPEEATTPLPAVDAPPAEICEVVDKVIAEANAELAVNQATAAIIWVNKVGPVVRLAKESGSWKEAVDPATDKVYRSWIKWGDDRGISKTHLYRLVKEVPVSKALEGVYTGQLTTRQVDFLYTVMRKHGGEAMAGMWQKAVEFGGPTLANLEKAKQALNLSTTASDDEDADELEAKNGRMLQLKAVRVDFDPDRLRADAARDPKAAREYADLLGTVRNIVLEAIGQDAQ
ncbi:hypothetical protein [Kitasatospora viridis]|uniref:Uncharacterized protein n=1 Tax=Kitasatospora viridis TaxID=281105 RepID=A0A561S9U6_9ACTN|nr:hypothetical protein [Kitasatospora viridis]TWF71649.1 hypothetical protein FHX73_1820 [Kitasatospora viridis]